ncbi:MAG: hypothetical protein EA409_09755 [Saprospirales bacterium]|nr:MAG: hypothetical protein EA409_09755 [Saprospirales bacterium]
MGTFWAKTNPPFQKKSYIEHSIKTLNMKYVVLSFYWFEPNPNYQIKIDEGQGLRFYEIEHHGTFFPLFTDSPIGMVNGYCNEHGYEVIQVVEEEGYKHLRFYLKKVTAGTQEQS